MPLIQATNITKNYRVGDMDVPALKGLSFEIGEGAFAAFVGPSGSGKSTLLNLIGCLDHPTNGTLNIILPGMTKEGSTWQLHDLSGRLLDTGRMASGSVRTSVDLGRVADGSYLLHVFTGGERLVRTVVVRH